MSKANRAAYLAVCATAEFLGDDPPSPNSYGLDMGVDHAELGARLVDVPGPLRPPAAWFLIVPDETPGTEGPLYHTGATSDRLLPEVNLARFFPSERAAATYKDRHGLTDTKVVEIHLSDE